MWLFANPPSGVAKKQDNSGCAMARSFLVYRLFLALVLVVLFYMELDGSFLGSHSPQLYRWSAWSYLGAIGVGLVIYLRHTESCERQAYLMVFLDIPAVVLMTYASGGIATGLSLLLAVSIAFGGSIMRGRAVLVFSAIASLAVIVAEIYADLGNIFPQTHYTQAGFMGGAFFAMAILAEAMARRLRESERLISQRDIDLADMAQLNRYIIQRIETGIVVVDTQARVRLFNEAAFRLLGMPETRLGRPLSELSQDLASALAAWKGHDETATEPFSPRGAAHQLQGHLVRLGRKNTAGILIFIDDVSALAERAHRLKLASLGRLVASIAHEVRNPLGAISHAEQLLRESSNLDEGDRRLTSIIHKHSVRVNGIIEDMLMLSRRGNAAPEEILLAEFVARFANEMREHHALNESGIDVRCYAPLIRVTVDPGQFRQILDNLVSNAVVHFDREPSELEVMIGVGLSKRFGNPYLDVRDNGPGVAEEIVEQIFDPFFTTSPTGTGLGLFITKELCEANRMRLEYRNFGNGSRFRVIFPKQAEGAMENDGQ